MPKNNATVRAVAKLNAFKGEIAIEGITNLPAGLRLVLAYPPVPLNPNNRSLHPARKAGIAKRYRQDCWERTLEAFGLNAGKRLFPGDGKIRVHLDFFPPNRSSRDDDNAEAAFKSGRDGVASCLGIDDARFSVSRSLRVEPRDCVVMTLGVGDDA